MPNPAPGFAKHPSHTVTIAAAQNAVSVIVGGELVHRTDAALELVEAKYPLAYYLPLASFPAELLTSSDHTTYCPFKGTANYFHLKHGDRVFENAVWTYADPYDEALAIKDHIAIYPNVATVEPE